MNSKEKARELVLEAEKILNISGAHIILVKKEMEDIERKSQENIKKLSLLL